MIKKLFRRLFVVIIVFLVLQIARVLLDRQSPNSVLFHQSLVAALQTLTIVWFVLAFLLDLVFIRSTKVKKTGLISLAIMVVVITIGEVFAFSWIKHPERIPHSMQTGYKMLYAHNYGQVIQIVPECSEYDADFFYNLRPNNTCTFSNIEFSNQYTTNSRGFRDDDSSLVKPAVICLGDSYMMGWGVDQQEAIPAQIEKLTGKKTLNAAMSSFGTAREMMRYKTLDTSAVNYIVIQYCTNDNEENKSYTDHHNKLPISSRASYDSLRVKNDWNKKYFPGKYFVLSTKYLMKEKIKSWMGKPPSVIGLPVEYPRDARMFLDILKVMPVNFQKTKIIVFEGIDVAHRNNTFKTEVEKLLQELVYKDHFGSSVQVIDIASLLTEKDFFIIDGHFNAVAHRKVAEAIARQMQ